MEDDYPFSTEMYGEDQYSVEQDTVEVNANALAGVLAAADQLRYYGASAQVRIDHLEQINHCKFALMEDDE